MQPNNAMLMQAERDAALQIIARDARLMSQRSPVTVEEYRHVSDFAAVYREVAAGNRALLPLMAAMPQC